MIKQSILFYFNSLSPAGGIERVISTLANKLCTSFDITILVKGEPISFYPLHPDVRLFSLGNELEFDMDSRLNRVLSVGKSIYQNTRKLKAYLEQHQFDFYYLAHPLNVLEFHCARGVRKTDTIVTEHGAPDAYNFVYKAIKRLLYPKSKMYVVPTTSDTELYKSRHLPAMYIPHFRSALPYEKSDRSKRVALTVGRVTEAKRQWILIDLWDRIVNHHDIRNWHLHIVGDGNLKESFHMKIRQLGLVDYVHILPPRLDVEFYYKNASIFLLTSQSEGFGMVILEALSFGVPCVSYDCPSGPRDMIDDGENGFLVPFDDFDKLEEAVLSLMQDDVKRSQIADRAYEGSRKWADVNTMRKWMSVFKK